MKNKRMMIFAALVLSVFTAITALSYAFFKIEVNNDKKTNATITTGTMSMTFSDYSNEIVAELDFDESVTKEFKIQNTGTLDVGAKLQWDNLVNTYLEKSLEYTVI